MSATALRLRTLDNGCDLNMFRKHTAAMTLWTRLSMLVLGYGVSMTQGKDIGSSADAGEVVAALPFAGEHAQEAL